MALSGRDSLIVPRKRRKEEYTVWVVLVVEEGQPKDAYDLYPLPLSYCNEHPCLYIHLQHCSYDISLILV